MSGAAVGTVPVYRWTLTVTLIKMVDRTEDGAARYLKSVRAIELADYLGDGGAVQTTKSLRGEAAGGFSISFGDQPDPETQDTLYSLIEPQDMVEIRAARSPDLYSGEDLPLIMRGFVSSIRRAESMGEDGTPRRGVVVSGHDFGKLWMIHAVWPELAIVVEQPMLTVFGLQAQTGLSVAVLDIEDFMGQFVTKVMNPKVEKMASFSSQQVKPFVLETSVKEGRLVPNVVSGWSGPYWSIVTAFADMPWNELFIRDEEDGPHFVFRPSPFKGLDGKLILPGAKDPGTVQLTDAEIVQWDVTRSDGRVANFFWTPPGSSSLDTNGLSVAGALVDGSALDFQHGNNAPELYGEKKMEAPTALIPDDAPGQPDTLPPDERSGAGLGYVQWYRRRADQLRAMNRDNSVLEDGAAVVMGREEYTIGKYIRLVRGNVESEAYVTAVSHNLDPLGNWSTTLSFERGTGFLERNRADISPYGGEGRRGPYSPGTADGGSTS